MEPTTVLLPEDLKRWLTAQAIMQHKSRGELIRELLAWFRREGRPTGDLDPIARRVNERYGRETAPPPICVSRKPAARSKK